MLFSIGKIRMKKTLEKNVYQILKKVRNRATELAQIIM
jgi:hypothetical protein